jgi:hypothetical protein
MKLETLRANAEQWLTLWRLNEQGDPGPEMAWGQYAAYKNRNNNPLMNLVGQPGGVELGTIVHFHLRWALLQYPVFSLSHGLTAKLLLTDCSGIRFDEIKWPFNAFVVQLPGPEPFIVYSDDEGKEVTANFVSLHTYTQAPLKSSTVFDRGSFESVIRAQTELCWRFCLWNPINSVTIRKQYPAPKRQEDLQALIFDSEFNELPLLPIRQFPVDELANAAMVRLMLNFSLYLDDLRVTEKWNEEKADNEKHIKRHEGKVLRKWNVGREIKLSPEIRALSHSKAVSDPAWKLRSRFLVRGHWRNQPFGVQKEQRRRQWIEPFWKGPQEGERLERAYRVDNKEKE